MDDLKLQTAPRQVLGKKTRFLRRQGITPVHLFGHNVDNTRLGITILSLETTSDDIYLLD